MSCGRRWGLASSCGLLLLASALSMARADRADTPGRFDYWLLALSWSPQYCASSSRAEPQQCASARPYGFIVHGLWPQYERGYPRRCQRRADVPEALVERMLPLMPSTGLIQHEWREHGSCSGFSSADYFARIEQLWRGLRIPPRYRSPSQPLRLSPEQIEIDFIRDNPQLGPDGIALQCSGPYLREIRLCYDRRMQPRDCGIDVRDRCGSQVLLRPIRRSR